MKTVRECQHLGGSIEDRAGALGAGVRRAVFLRLRAVGARVGAFSGRLVGAQFALAMATAVVILIAARPAAAFMGSEDQQFQADIDEAKKRAHDFKRTLERISSDQKDIEAAGKLQGPIREREMKELETDRRDFVRVRNNRPSPEIERERLERDDSRLKAKEEKEMEADRRQYVIKRDQVRRVLEREAYIDEKLEYGL